MTELPPNLGVIPTLGDLRLGSTALCALPGSLAAPPIERIDLWDAFLCDLDPLLEPKVDSLAGLQWREVRALRCQ